MEKWISDHPWMTFFIALAAIDGVVYIVRGPQPVTINVPPGAMGGPSSAAAPVPMSATPTQTAAGALGTHHPHGKLFPWLTPAPYLHATRGMCG